MATEQILSYRSQHDIHFPYSLYAVPTVTMTCITAHCSLQSLGLHPGVVVPQDGMQPVRVLTTMVLGLESVPQLTCSSTYSTKFSYAE